MRLVLDAAPCFIKSCMQDLEVLVRLENGHQKVLVLPAALLSWTAVRSPGPGGQNVNKVASKIELRVDFERCSAIPLEVKQRIRSNFPSSLDANGQLFLTCSESRSQSQNLELALEKVRKMIQGAYPRPKTRRPTKPSRGAKRRRMDEKSRQSEKKSGRRKFRADD